MAPQNDLEIKGTFYAHPFAELLAEIAQAELTGSLRASRDERKCVLYFKSGRVVFAVSNARESRLFAMLLKRKRLTENDLKKIPNFANDLELSAQLRDTGVITNGDHSRLFSEQIEALLVDLLAWDSGEWSFDTLARIRDGLAFDVAIGPLLIEFGRCMPVEKMLGRFRSFDETFTRSAVPEIGFSLRPEEAFVLSRADTGDLSASSMVSVAAMNEEAALHAIYTLWLGGLLLRREWQPAFSPAAVAAIRSARLELKQEAVRAGFEPSAETEPVKEPVKEPVAEITLDEYLERVEKSQTHYDILGTDVKAETAELKRAYFSLAKMFHPDRFHAEGGMTLKRIQNAFTQLAQAHETLKSQGSREIYDYRMRKELAERERREAAGTAGDYSFKVDQARENFDTGFRLLMDKEYERSAAFLSRAVHFDPKNARYRAYYGKSLSFDPKQRHKAESEMQAALKIDPNNATFRLLLAEFFIQNNLKKRAEGELNRLLAIAPNNGEARDLLATLQ